MMWCETSDVTGRPDHTPLMDATPDTIIGGALTCWCVLPATQYGYGKGAPGRANLSLCSKQIGQQFDCLALTLEVIQS